MSIPFALSWKTGDRPNTVDITSRKVGDMQVMGKMPDEKSDAQPDKPAEAAAFWGWMNFEGPEASGRVDRSSASRKNWKH